MPCAAWKSLPGALCEAGGHFIHAQLNKGESNSVSLFSEVFAGLAWLAKMLGNLASKHVNWLV